MKSSLVLATTVGLLSTGGLLAGGCQIIAGVHSDGELLTGGTGGVTTTGTGGTGGTTGGTGGVGPCQSPADCPGQVCLAGACVSPKCVASGAPVVLFDSAELGGHDIDEKRMHLVADGDRIHIIVADRDQPRLLARTWSSDAVNPGSTIVEFDLAANGGSNFNFARFENGDVYVHGRWAEQIGHVLFSTTGQTIDSNPTFVPYPALPASCLQPNGGPTNVGFDHVVGDVTRYAVECEGQSGRVLLVGGNYLLPEVVAGGPADDPTLHLRGYLDRADGVQLLLTGGGDTDPTHYRAGADSADLSVDHEVVLDADPNTLNFIANPIHTPAGEALFLGATVSSIDSKGALWAGILSDYAGLSTVPPQGVAPILTFDAPPFTNLSDLEAHPSGYYAVGPSMDGRTLNVLWLDPGATTILVSFGAVVSLPAADTGSIIGASVVRGTLSTAAAYAVLRDGAVSVEGARFLCSY